jgi:archaellum biogenesis ATPase FlaH
MLILRLWRQQPGKYFCISTKSAAKTWRDHFFSKSEFPQVQGFIDRNKDKDLYFCPCGFTERRRLEKFAVLPHLMWSDMDEADPRKAEIQPTIAIESSPGRFVGLWVLNEALDCKETNQALTYFLGADKGGWDLPQVLRIPGTTNYKYQSTPRVRTLWTDGPQYSLRDIKQKLPKKTKHTDDDNAHDVYKQYEKSLPHWARRELLNGKPQLHKRSDMMWKLCNTLLESGVSRDDTFTLLRASPWNKFSDDQLDREIEKAGGRKFKGKQEPEKKKDGYHFLTRSLEDVEEEDIDWIWYPYLAKGELTILEGDPGVGKSYLAQIVCAHLLDGKRLPSVKRLKPITGKIAYFDMENSAGSVTKKRFIHNECENLADFYQEEEPFSIDDEDVLEQVFDAIERLKPIVVVFDTLNTYIGKADIHKSSETQQAFARFREIAKRFGCSVLVLRHLTKGTKERALYRGQGSIAFAGLARVVMTVGLMPDDEDTRVMAVTKINVTRPPKALTFTITELPDTMKDKDRSKFEWGEFVDITSEDIVTAAPKKEKGREREDAKSFLEDALAKGPVEVVKLERLAEGKSVSWRTVQRAADALGVVREARGFGKEKTSYWSLK